MYSLARATAARKSALAKSRRTGCAAARSTAGAATGHDLAAKSARAQERARRQADERIAAEALAADDRLEQEAEPARRCLAAGQLEVQRKRCLKIGEGFRDQRNPVESLQRQALEFEFGHRMPRRGRGLHVWQRAAAARDSLRK